MVGSTAFSERYTYSDGESGDGALTSMTTADGDTLSFSYDKLRRLQNYVASSAEGTALYMNAYGYKTVTGSQTSALVEYNNIRAGGATDGAILLGWKYEYDALGNITKIYEAHRAIAAYTYDDLNQLATETIYGYASETATAASTTTIYTYTYDTAGNIRTVAKNGTTTQTYTYGDADWLDLLTAVNGNAIAYDANGNPTTYHNGTAAYTNLTWEQGRQLASITKGTTTTSYDYDADGIRSKKTVGTTVHTYVTQNGKVICETIGSSNGARVLDFIYDNQGRPYALNYSANGGNTFATYYYLLNLQGDVVALTDDSGAIAVRYTYNAWGELRSVTDVNSNPITSTAHIAHINPLRYRGYYYDTETGFYYLQSRYYAPVCHRFINADGYASTGQGFTGTNMFAYCGNNPVVNADTTGELWAEIIIATTLIVAMAATLVACSEEEKIGQRIARTSIGHQAPNLQTPIVIHMCSTIMSGMIQDMPVGRE